MKFKPEHLLVASSGLAAFAAMAAAHFGPKDAAPSSSALTADAARSAEASRAADILYDLDRKVLVGIEDPTRPEGARCVDYTDTAKPFSAVLEEHGVDHQQATRILNTCEYSMPATFLSFDEQGRQFDMVVISRTGIEHQAAMDEWSDAIVNAPTKDDYKDALATSPVAIQTIMGHELGGHAYLRKELWDQALGDAPLALRDRFEETLGDLNGLCFMASQEGLDFARQMAPAQAERRTETGAGRGSEYDIGGFLTAAIDRRDDGFDFLARCADISESSMTREEFLRASFSTSLDAFDRRVYPVTRTALALEP